MAKQGYELWRLSTANCVGYYKTEAEALADVAEVYCRYGRDEAEDTGMSGPTIQGSLSGRALVDKALGWQRKTA